MFELILAVQLFTTDPEVPVVEPVQVIETIAPTETPQCQPDENINGGTWTDATGVVWMETWICVDGFFEMGPPVVVSAPVVVIPEVTPEPVQPAAVPEPVVVSEVGTAVTHAHLASTGPEENIKIALIAFSLVILGTTLSILADRKKRTDA